MTLNTLAKLRHLLHGKTTSASEVKINNFAAKLFEDQAHASFTNEEWIFLNEELQSMYYVNYTKYYNFTEAIENKKKENEESDSEEEQGEGEEDEQGEEQDDKQGEGEEEEEQGQELTMEPGQVPTEEMDALYVLFYWKLSSQIKQIFYFFIHLKRGCCTSSK